MDNYEFCAQWILEHAHSGAHVLDYGCGAGQIVTRLRNAGVAAFGCDVFYEGGDYSKQMGGELFDGGVIRRMDANRIPFETESFDFVVNNQVMEHVPDLDGVLNEIWRVLKPGGMVLSLFPDRGVWREGHCGIPFLHWFPKGGNRVRIYYAALLRSVGFGYFKGEKASCSGAVISAHGSTSGHTIEPAGILTLLSRNALGMFAISKICGCGDGFPPGGRQLLLVPDGRRGSL